MDTEDDVLTTMSHELRGPLNAILGWVQLLRAGGACAPDVDRALAIIERNAREEARAVDDAIDLARLASGQVQVSKHETRWVEALRAALAAQERAAEARGIRIEVEADHELRVVADLRRLVQIARGLVASAIRRSTSGGVVQVRLVREANEAVLWAREDRSGDGSRIDGERSDIRDRRAHLLGDARGLGVAVARGLVRVHGGRFEEDEGGARVVARLPLAPSMARRPAATPVPVRV